MKQAYTFVFLPFFLVTPLANAQTLHYDVYYGDSPVGTMRVERKLVDGKEVLSSYGQVKLSLIWTLELEFIHRAEFKSGTLLSSLTKNLRGGELTDLSSGYQSGSSYQNRVNDEIKLANLPIHHTVLTMYFAEPKGLSAVYSERTGVHLPVKSIGPNRYEMTQHNGHPTRYSYQNGVCTWMEVGHSLATLEFRLRK